MNFVNVFISDFIGTPLPGLVPFKKIKFHKNRTVDFVPLSAKKFKAIPAYLGSSERLHPQSVTTVEESVFFVLDFVPLIMEA